MLPNQPQGLKSPELANVPQSGIGEAARNRFQTITTSAHLVYTVLQKRVEQSNPPLQATPNYNVGAVATAYSHDIRPSQDAATMPVETMYQNPATQTVDNTAPTFMPEEGVSQHVATQSPDESSFLKEEEARNYIGQIHEEIDAERQRLAQQTPPSQDGKGDYGLAA